jgi:nitrogen regulatory protein P-II 1
MTPEHVGAGVMEYTPDFGTRTKIEILVTDSKLNQIVDNMLQTISRASDGKIFIYDVADAIDKEQRRLMTSCYDGNS